VQTGHMRAARAIAIFASVLVSAIGLSACAASAGGPTVAVFAPVHSVGASVLAADAAVLTKRLRIIRNASDRVSVSGSSVVITGTKLKIPAADLIPTGQFYIRPVLCGAPAYSPSASPKAARGPLPSCGPDATTATNLSVNTTTGQPSHDIPPAPAFASYPSTQNDNPRNVVLLPDDPVAGAQQYPRFVLGHAALGTTAIATASAVLDTTIDQWVVTYNLTPAGARAWDRVARANFHEYVALDLDGLVESAPLIQPNQDVFTSFGGRGEISGDFTPVSARSLAAVIASGPLVVPLRPSGR
jgi:hypothetical protein